MLAKIVTFGLLGLEAYPIVIETDISPGMPFVTVVGLPDNAVKESRERVRSALGNNGFNFPYERITINLSPADIKKEGPSFDLAMALSVLAASGQIPLDLCQGYAFLGELSLEGVLQPVNGVLSIALACEGMGLKGLIVPQANAHQAAMAQSVPVFPAAHLKEVLNFLNDKQAITAFNADPSTLLKEHRRLGMDFTDVKGQWATKRGLEIAAGGGHNVLMIGPPGSGKTMLAKRLAGILPEMTFKEILQTTQIHSTNGPTKSTTAIITQRPFRSPHHTTSDIALIGGGSMPRPGEVTLAHNGILFLDELPEFSRSVLEVLRQPLEDGVVTIARAKTTLTFPAKFMLVASMNPCPCGWLGNQQRTCRCTPLEVRRYQQKISGPLLDRIDIHLQVPLVKAAQLWTTSREEHSVDIKERTMAARQIQTDRFAQSPTLCNAQMTKAQMQEHCHLDEEGKTMIQKSMETLQLSARAHDKILKVARTISDLEGCTDIQPQHIAEAIGYRILDRMK